MDDITLIILITTVFALGLWVGFIFGWTSRHRIEIIENEARTFAIQKIACNGMDTSFELGKKLKEQYMHTLN